MFADEIMTLNELAQYLKISDKSLLKMVNNQEIPGMKVGNQWRFQKVVIDDWLTSRSRTVKDETISDIIKKTDVFIPFSRLLYPGKVVLDIKPGTKEEVLRQLVKPLISERIVGDIDGFIVKLLEREKLVSTALGRGVAVPHPRHPEEIYATRSAMVFGRCREGVDFESPDGKPVFLFFLVCATGEVVHLRIISRLAWMLRDVKFLDQLMLAPTSDEILSLIVKKESEQLVAEKR